MTTPATLRLLSAFHYESARANLGYARVLRRFGAEAAAASAILRARESRRLARAARSHPRVVPTDIEVTTPYSGGCPACRGVGLVHNCRPR